MQAIFIIGLILCFIKSFDFIYLFQIKEYRLDRFFSMLNENNPLVIFYFNRLHLPAKKLRNLSIILSVLVIFITIFFTIKPTNLLIIWLFAFYPLISFAMVLLCVLISSLPVNFYRKQVINKAKSLVNQSQAVFIGITGSYGKTTTKEFLFQILSKKFRVAKTDNNQNTDIGIALSIIKNLKPNTQYFIAELGAYKKSEIKKACEIIKPEIGILTGIGNQHLDLFGSKKQLIEAKKELLQALPEKGRGYINQEILNDVSNASLIKDLSCKVIAYSNLKNAGLEPPIQLPIGSHNLVNLTAAAVAARDLNISKTLIIQAIQQIRPLQGKLSIHSGINRSTIINDSSNSSGEGFIAAIKAINAYPQSKKIILSKGIIELGQEKKSTYKKILSEIYQTHAVLYTTDRLFKSSDKKNRVFFFSNENQILASLNSHLGPDTVIVVEGRFTSSFISALISNRI